MQNALISYQFFIPKKYQIIELLILKKLIYISDFYSIGTVSFRHKVTTIKGQSIAFFQISVNIKFFYLDASAYVHQ